MILDKLENAHLYTNLSKQIAEAFEILKDPALSEKEDGRYDIDGDNLFYLVQRYQTKPLNEGKLEAHKKYIDIQFVAEGTEIIGYAPLQNLEIDTAYNEEKDCIFYKPGNDLSALTVSQDMFCILYPQDSHMPCRHINSPSEIIKIVIKVKLNAE